MAERDSGDRDRVKLPNSESTFNFESCCRNYWLKKKKKTVGGENGWDFSINVATTAEVPLGKMSTSSPTIKG